MLLSAYPGLLWLHLVALIVWGGTMLIAEAFQAAKRISLGLAAISGVLLFAAKSDEYSHNPTFWIKMALLVLLGVISVFMPKGKLRFSLSLLLMFAAIAAARGPATVKDVMHSMVDPSADFVFESVQTVANETGIHEIAPQTDEEWQDVRARLLVLMQVKDLLSTPGIRAARPRDRSASTVENEPYEVQALIDSNRQDFVNKAQRLRDAAAVAMRAVEGKDKNALMDGLIGIDQACEVCHLRYWYPRDKRAVEAAKEAGIIE